MTSLLSTQQQLTVCSVHLWVWLRGHWCIIPVYLWYAWDRQMNRQITTSAPDSVCYMVQTAVDVSDGRVWRREWPRRLRSSHWDIELNPRTGTA